jgi:hypothetical protein
MSVGGMFFRARGRSAPRELSAALEAAYADGRAVYDRAS